MPGRCHIPQTPLQLTEVLEIDILYLLCIGTSQTKKDLY